MRARLFRFLVVAALLTTAAAVPTRGAAVQRQSATPAAAGAPADPRLFEAVRFDLRESVAAETAGRLSRYRLEADLDPGIAIPTNPDGAENGSPPYATLTGTLDLDFVNATEETLDEIYFRLYPNDPRYAEGGLELSDVTINGSALSPRLSVDDTVARLTLPAPLAPSGTTKLSLAFTSTVASTFDFFSGAYNVDSVSGTLALSHWYPILAGYDPDTGWVLDPPTFYGDVVFADAALYDASITVPPQVTLVATGLQVDERESAGRVRHDFVTGPARQFMMAAYENVGSASRVVDGTTVVSYFRYSSADAGEDMLAAAAAALSFFNDRFGPYPYARLNVIGLPLGAAAGTEFAQVIALDSALYESPSVLAELGLTDRLVEFIVAQGVASQWWSGVVGVNHYAHPFLDESLSEYAAAVYIGERHGRAERERVIDLADRALYASAALVSGDQIVDQPGDAFPDSGSYFGSVYAKGALGFHALADAIGEDTLLAALDAFAERYRFVVASPADLRATIEQVADQDIDAFWQAWFESNSTRLAIRVTTPLADTAATPTP